MAETLVTVEELAGRLPFVMNEDEMREAQGALDDLSDDARHYGRSSWTTADNTPRQILNLILRAAARHMKNYDGFTQSRAGDEAVSWTDRGHEAGSAYFTAREVQTIKQVAGHSTGFYSTKTAAWGPSDRPVRSTGDLIRDEGGFTLPLYVPGTDL